MLGTIAAVDNTDDCVGIAPKSFIHFASGVAPGGRMSESELFLLMHRVGFRLGPGDVLNVSVAHRELASGDLYPIDFRPATRSAAQLLSFRGTIVVEAVGNGRPSA